MHLSPLLPPSTLSPPSLHCGNHHAQPASPLEAAYERSERHRKGAVQSRRRICLQRCADSAFCQRLRGKAGDVYAVQPATLHVEGASLTARVLNEANKAEFDLRLTSYGSSVRLLIDEAPPNNRYQVLCPPSGAGTEEIRVDVPRGRCGGGKRPG